MCSNGSSAILGENSAKRVEQVKRSIAVLAIVFAVSCVNLSIAQDADDEPDLYPEDRYAPPRDYYPEKGGLDITGPYEWVRNWLEPVEEGRIIHPNNVMAESEDRVFIGLNGTSPLPKPDENRMFWPFKRDYPGARVDHQMYAVNRNGDVIEEWDQWYQIFGHLHKIAMNPYDPEKHIWVLDRKAHQVFKFTNDGKELVMSVGTFQVPGDTKGHFNMPADITFLPEGSFYVADGFGNNRVVKYDKDGNYLLEWGSKGTGPGQFNLVDAVTVDAERRVYVTDRRNGRIQIFDEYGKYLDEWGGFLEPMKVIITMPDENGEQHAWVLDAPSARLAKFDLNGKLLDYWGVDSDPDGVGPNGGGYYKKLVPGGFSWPHDAYVDPQGNLYVSNGRIWRVDKYVPRKDAPKERLIDPFMPRSPSP